VQRNYEEFAKARIPGGPWDTKASCGRSKMQRTENWFHKRADVLAVDPSRSLDCNDRSPKTRVTHGKRPFCPQVSAPSFPVCECTAFDNSAD